MDANTNIKYSFYATPAVKDIERFSLISIEQEQDKAPNHIDRSDGWDVEHLIYTINGAGIAHIDGEKFSCSSSDILITPKSKPYVYEVDPDIGFWEYRWIEFTGAWVHQIWSMMGLTGIYYIPECVKADSIISELFSYIKKNKNYGLHKASAILWQLFAAAEETLYHSPNDTD